MKQFAPAAAHAPMVSGVALMPPSTCVEINRYHHTIEQATIQHEGAVIFTPPSTSMSTSKFRSTIHLRIFSILSVIVGM